MLTGRLLWQWIEGHLLGCGGGGGGLDVHVLRAHTHGINIMLAGNFITP